MKIILDTDVCKKKGMDIDVALYLLSSLAGSTITVDTYEKARTQGFLRFGQPYNRSDPFPMHITLSDTGEFVAEGIMAESNSGTRDNERLTTLANKLRELFPAGKKPGYAYTWRDSTSCIVDRLKKFFLKYGDYPDDDIIRVTKNYVDSFNGNYTYMQLLKYFIWKNKTTGTEMVNGRLVGEVERQSQLAAYLEDGEEETVAHNDWDVELV